MGPVRSVTSNYIVTYSLNRSSALFAACVELTRVSSHCAKKRMFPQSVHCNRSYFTTDISAVVEGVFLEVKSDFLSAEDVL